MRLVMKKWLWHFLFTGVCLIIACAALFQSATKGLHAVPLGKKAGKSGEAWDL
jgi:hypothetical protein